MCKTNEECLKNPPIVTSYDAVAKDDIVTSYDPVVDHRTTYSSGQTDSYPSAPAAAPAATAAHPYYTTFESHPYYTYFEPSPYRIPTEDETYAEWYYHQQQQQEEELTGGNAASVTYQQNHIPQENVLTHAKSSPLHEIKPEAPTKLSHATYTTPAAAAPGTVAQHERPVLCPRKTMKTRLRLPASAPAPARARRWGK